MSHPSRPQARGPASRRRRNYKADDVQTLEDRSLLSPVLSVSPRTAAITPITTPAPPQGTVNAKVDVTLGTPSATFATDAPFTTVTELTPISAFGGDIVRIEAGPGGDFGKGIYAISRGAGDNGLPANSDQNVDTAPPTVNGAANRPGVIYRVDPATGKASVFFDLNTVIPQLDKTQSSAANSVGASTGLVNWYDITFDPEGYFDGKPSMFVASVDRSNPAKNAIYRIAPDGTFMGAFVQFTNGQSALKFTVNPSAVLVPPPEDQTFLRGLLAGGGVSSTGGQFSALYFDANAYSPGQNIKTGTLPPGVSQTGMTLGPITGLTAANSDYFSRAYSAFTDFGTPAGGGIPSSTGLSGVQGLNGELLIGNTVAAGSTALSTSGFATSTSTNSTIGDSVGAIPSEFRRFEDIAFDQYGYFTQGTNLSATATTTNTNTTATVNGGNVLGSNGGVGTAGSSATLGGYVIVNNTLVRPGITLPPANAGNLFVADLGTGLSVPVTPSAKATDGTTLNPAPAAFRVPVQGPETVSVVTNPDGTVSTTITPSDIGLGGRIVRITPDGTVSNFAENFHTSNNLDASGFALSSLSISFSADGTTLYAADDDGIWQFKTVASLAGSSSGSLIGLNDLRSLGVPYEGQDSAVDVIDTGIDANNPYFRGRVAAGTNVFTNGFGNDDTSPGFSTTGTTTTTGGNTGTGNGNNTVNPAPAVTADGHGTPVAGVIAQFVPQATLVPINIFAPFLAGGTSTTTTTNTGGNNNNNGGTLSAASNALTSSQYLYQGLGYAASHPFVNDPVRPGRVDRVIAAEMGFGSTTTFDTERSAYRQFPHVTIALKNQLKKFRSLGIAPIAAAGQFGAPLGASQTATNNTGGNNNNNTGVTTQVNNNASNASAGDINGMSLPAILNEVISVSGSLSYPFVTGPGVPPTNPPAGILPRPLIVPALVFGNSIQLGGTATTGTGTGTNGNTGGTNNNANANTVGFLTSLLTAGNIGQYTDRIVAASNRSITTDFIAPAVNVPTFRRTFVNTTSTTTTGTTAATGSNSNPSNHNTFSEAGTSMSSAIVTGAYALVSSALSYWANLNHTGVTSDAYLTQPVGVRTLNFGPHAFIDLTQYNNPDGINSILQWTAVPTNDPNDALSINTPKYQFGSTEFRNYSRISVSNAIAAIEGEVALQYLIAHNDFQYIDANKNGIISAQELQDFVDNAAKIGMPEAGAMARLLGGTARPAPTAESNPYGFTASITPFDEQPDQPDVLQRRFNFFDYAADGTLNGSVTTAQLNMLAHTLLPTPDAFVVNDRQRSSVINYLIAPTTHRNYADLMHYKPSYFFIPKGKLTPYQNISPAKFHVDRGLAPSVSQFPVYTLYDGPTRGQAPGKNSGGAQTPAATPTTPPVTPTTPPATATVPTGTGTPAASNPASATGAGTGTGAGAGAGTPLASAVLAAIQNAAKGPVTNTTPGGSPLFTTTPTSNSSASPAASLPPTPIAPAPTPTTTTTPTTATDPNAATDTTTSADSSSATTTTGASTPAGPLKVAPSNLLRKFIHF